MGRYYGPGGEDDCVLRTVLVNESVEIPGDLRNLLASMDVSIQVQWFWSTVGADNVLLAPEKHVIDKLCHFIAKSKALT
jgi:hypothetical protein